MFDSGMINDFLPFITDSEDMDTDETLSVPCPREHSYVKSATQIMTDVELYWDELCEKFYELNDEYIDNVNSDDEYESPTQSVVDYLDNQLNTFTYIPMDDLESLLVFLYLMSDDIENHHPELWQHFINKMEAQREWFYRINETPPCKAWFESVVVQTFCLIGYDWAEMYCQDDASTLSHLENSFNLVAA